MDLIKTKNIVLGCLLAVIIIILLVSITKSEGFIDKAARADMIVGKGERAVSSFSTYKKHIPDGDAVEYTDLKKLKAAGAYNKEAIMRAI